MPGLEDYAMPFILVIAFVVLTAFWLGTRANVRAGERAMKWLREGLPVLGEKTTMNWIGSAALVLRIAKAKGAYRNTEIVFSFEPRDVVFLWLFARWQGRRDLMIFRGTLNAAPSFELEVFDPQGWTTRSTEREAQKKNWKRVDLSGQPGLHAYYSGAADVTIAQSFSALATRAGGKLLRLSIRRNVPNIEAHWLLPDPQTVSARALFADLREIGDQVVRG